MLRVSLIWKQFPDGLRITQLEQIKHEWNEGRSMKKNEKETEETSAAEEIEKSCSGDRSGRRKKWQ